MKSLYRLLCFTFLLALCFPALADAPYRPSDIQAALNQHDFATADREIQAVLVSSPNSAVAHYWAAKVLIEEHHAGQALIEVQKAQALPPPHFKDPAKVAAFTASLAKASTDLQKTINDEETALAHPHTTTTTTKRVIPGHVATAIPVSHLSTTPSLVSTIWVITGLLGIVLILVLIGRALFGTKPAVVQVVHTTDTMPPTSSGASQGVYDTGRPRPYFAGSNPSPPQRSTGFATAPSNAGPSGHSTGAVVGAGLGGLAAGVLLDEALHSHGSGIGSSGSGFGRSEFLGDNGGSEEIDTTTTTTGFDDSQVQDDYRRDDQDLSSNDTDNDFGGSDDGGGFSDDSSSSDDSF